MAPRVLVTSRPYQTNRRAVDALHRTGYDITMMKPGDAAQTDKLIRLIPGCDAMLAGAEPITRAVLEATDRLKVISRTGITVENVDLTVATEKGIVVTFTPGVNHDAVADFVLTLMLELARRAWYGYEIMRAGKWGPYQGIELPGKTVGIVGFGPIGKEVARRANGFRMEVLTNDPVQDHASARQVGATFVSLEEMLRRSDFVTLNCFPSPETIGMINSRTIALMKPTAFLINTARRGLVNEPDLLAALKEKRIAGTALDLGRDPVYDTPFAKLHNCIVTPHQAGYACEVQERMGLMAIDNMVAVLEGRCPATVANPEVYER